MSGIVYSKLYICIVIGKTHEKINYIGKTENWAQTKFIQ